MAEFRPRKIGEYFDILSKRRWMILLPTLAVGLAISYVGYRLPDLYESTTLIVVRRAACRRTISFRARSSAGTFGRRSSEIAAGMLCTGVPGAN